ncbi:hypothetical protein P7C71_g4444, partial [Lecanoromycetidae sp. Uapishka_2]
MDTHKIAEGDGVGLFKIRMDTGGEILIRVKNDNPFPGTTVKVEWRGNRLAKKEYQSIDNLDWVSQVGLPDMKTGPHEMIITLDRKDRGAVNLFVDGTLLANKTIPTVASPKIAQDIWFNAQEWSNLDTGFRGTLERFTMYADALTVEDIAMPIGTTLGTSSKISKLKTTLRLPESQYPPWALLLLPAAVLLFVLYLLRKRKGFLMAIPEYANRFPDLASSLPVLAGRVQNLAMNDLPAFARTVPSRALELAEQIPWPNTLKPKYDISATEDVEEDKVAAAEDGFHDTELGIVTAVGPEEDIEDPKAFE